MFFRRAKTLCFVLLLMGFALIPSLLALHFLGTIAGAIVFLVLFCAPFIFTLGWSLNRTKDMNSGDDVEQGGSIGRYSVHPAVVAIIGAVFAGAGTCFALSATQIDPARNANAMSEIEQRMAGLIFVCLGSGVAGIALLDWRHRRKNDNESADIHNDGVN